MLQIIVSILFGMIPEVLFFTLFIIETKKVKNKKIILGILIGITYILCVMIRPYVIIYYMIFILTIYIIMYMLYKQETQIIDIFVFSISIVYLSFIGFICSMFIKDDLSNYYYISVINRLLLFLPFLFKDKFNILYEKYKKLWNRNDKEKRILKSITLRNISLIFLNIFIFIMNIISISLTNYLNGGA